MQNKNCLLPEGIDEILPPHASALEMLRRTLLDLYASWGYEQVFPPLAEYLESLMIGTGSDLELQTFKLTDQISGRTLGIRADITTQTARIDAHQLRRDCPTRLCYAGTVLHTRTGGFAGSRAPLQVGAELYGHAGVESDLEVLCLMMESLKTAGLPNLYLDLGHVGIFRGLVHQAGLDRREELVLFDALQRKAIPEIETLLTSFQISEAESKMFTALAELSGDDALGRARDSLAGASKDVHNAISDLETLAGLLKQRLPSLKLHFDLAELRGYRYHTGIVFATFVPGLGQEVARGGRYDDIGGAFGRARPACGFSADLKTLFRVCAKKEPAAKDGIFAPWSDDPAQAQAINLLRAQGHRVVQGLPGQRGGPVEMGCGNVMLHQDGKWIVAAA